MSIKAVGFDLDDTLYNRNDLYEQVFNMMEEEVVKTDVDFVEFNTVFEKHSQNEYELFMDGEQDRDTYRIQRVIKAYRDFGYDITEADAEEFQKNYIKSQESLKFQEGALELIETLLDKDFTIFLLTNGPGAGQRKKIETLKALDWFDDDHIFISDELDLTKPDIEIFNYIEDKLQLKGEEILYIGDDLENDILGSHKANWHSIYLNPEPEGYEKLPNVSYAQSFKQAKSILEKDYNLI